MGETTEVRLEPPTEDYNDYGLMVAGSVITALGGALLIP